MCTSDATLCSDNPSPKPNIYHACQVLSEDSLRLLLSASGKLEVPLRSFSLPTSCVGAERSRIPHCAYERCATFALAIAHAFPARPALTSGRRSSIWVGVPPARGAEGPGAASNNTMPRRMSRNAA